MLECSYGKEPFDLRLTVLRLIRNLDGILVFTLAGTLLFGGGYYVKNVIFRGEVQYSVTSTYKVEYSDEEWAKYGTYINAATWNTHVHTEEFLDMVRKHLNGQEQTAASQETAGQKAASWERANEELGVMIKADLPSDLRVLTTTVTANSPEKSMAVARAVENAMTMDFPGVTNEVSLIRVTDSADSPQEVLLDARPFRAFVLSALLSFFFGIIIFLLKETGADSIWLPSAIRRRYGIPVLGTVNSPELSQNIAYLFRGKRSIAVCAVDGGTDPVQIASGIKECFEKSQKGGEDSAKEWIAVPSPVLCPEVCETIRKMDGILLAVSAGSHGGKTLEYVQEYLEQQDCEITAAILWNADEKLLKSYYCFPGGRS